MFKGNAQNLPLRRVGRGEIFSRLVWQGVTLISSRSGPKPFRLQSSPSPVDPASVFHYHYYCVYMSFQKKYIIYFRFCNIGVWREVTLRREIKSWQLSIFQWNYRYEFNSVIVWWIIWCPIYNMGYMKNKQNNEFSHFFFIDDIFYMIIRLQT